jgi:hypothetical protein
MIGRVYDLILVEQPEKLAHLANTSTAPEMHPIGVNRLE